MKILVFDTECNSLDIENGFIMEIAWAVYDSESKRLLRSRSNLIKWKKPYLVDDAAFEVTNLSRDFCEKYGEIPFNLRELLIEINDCDVICGHNITSFDLPMLKSNIAKIPGVTDLNLETKIIIDTFLDLPIKKAGQIMSLKYLALDHGYVMNESHQALVDVFACAHVLFSYDFDTVLLIAQTPMTTITVKPDWNDTLLRERLSQLRFRWNPTLKQWEKRTKEYFRKEIERKLEMEPEVKEENEELPF